MNRSVRLLSACLLVMILSAIPVAAADETIENTMKRFRQTALTERKGFGWLHRLCGDGGRLTGSTGLAEATETAQQIMAEAGLQNIHLQPVKVPGWKRGTVEAVIVSPESHAGRHLSVAALGRSVPTPVGGVTAPIVRVSSLAELKLLDRETAAGAIILIDHPFPDGVLRTFDGYGRLARGRVFGAAEASHLGAAAVLVRSISTRSDNVPHLGTLTYDGAHHPIPGASVGVQDAILLGELAAAGKPVSLRLKMDCDPAGEVTGYNVIGEIPGSRFPDQVILVGGHIDSWDAGDGAHDNGTGCIHSIEALSLFNRLGIRPACTLRCVLFVSEEYGSHGARAYADWQRSSSERLIAALESDRGGFVPRGFYVTAAERDRTFMMEWLPLLRHTGIDWIRKGGSGADTSHLDMARVRLGLVVDSQRYFDVHHSANDVLSAVHPREFELGSAALASMIYLLSEQGLPVPSSMDPETMVE